MSNSWELIVVVVLSYVILAFTILTLVLDMFVAEATFYGILKVRDDEPITIWDFESEEDQIVVSIVFSILSVTAAVVANGTALAYFLSYNFRKTQIVSFGLVSIFSAIAWITFFDVSNRIEIDQNAKAVEMYATYKHIYLAGFYFMVTNTILGFLCSLFVIYRSSPENGFNKI